MFPFLMQQPQIGTPPLGGGEGSMPGPSLQLGRALPGPLQLGFQLPSLRMPGNFFPEPDRTKEIQELCQQVNRMQEEVVSLQKQVMSPPPVSQTPEAISPPAPAIWQSPAEPSRLRGMLEQSL